MAFCVSLVWGKNANCHVVGTGVWKVEIVRNWFGSISVFFLSTSQSCLFNFLQVSLRQNFFCIMTYSLYAEDDNGRDAWESICDVDGFFEGKTRSVGYCRMSVFPGLPTSITITFKKRTLLRSVDFSVFIRFSGGPWMCWVWRDRPSVEEREVLRTGQQVTSCEDFVKELARLILTVSWLSEEMYRWCLLWTIQEAWVTK